MQSETHHVEILTLTHDTVTFHHNGEWGSMTGTTASASANDLQTLAASHVQRAEDCLRRAAIMLAVAEIKERDSIVRGQAALKQRNERAAATRARNADPFGFKAAGY